MVDKIIFLLIITFVHFFGTLINGSIVNTTNGFIQGHLVRNNQVTEFMGIPFAQPPIGELRFTAPKTILSWDGVYDANFISPGCPQQCTLANISCPKTISEDCLYLNIWTPVENSNDELLPVYFWIHGGAFTEGIGNSQLYNGSELVQNKKIIVVTANYRLGVFGFLASDIFAGNYGLLDQRVAIEWVRENINNFGGDPKKITLGGQSAGAMSILCHLTSEGSKNLFQQVIMESNPFSIPYHTRSQASEDTKYVAESLRCRVDDIACFKNATVDDLLTAQDFATIHVKLRTIFESFLPFTPVVEDEIIGDGTDNSTGWNALNEQPFYAFRETKFPQKPILSGSVSEDGRLFVYYVFSSPVPSYEYDAAIFLLFGISETAAVIEMYPPDLLNNASDTRDVLSLIATDLLFYCPLRNASRELVSQLPIDLYLYYFSHAPTFNMWSENSQFCNGHACHGSELPFIFDVFTDGESEFNITSDETILSQNAMIYWANFINFANPSDASDANNILQWSPYSSGEENVINLDQPLSELNFFRSTYCDFWDFYGYFY